MSDEWEMEVINGAEAISSAKYPLIAWVSKDYPKILPDPNNQALRKTFRGFHVRKGANSDMDDAFTALGITEQTVRFNDGNTEIHWILGESVEVIALTRGLQRVRDTALDIYKLTRGLTIERFGIAMGWTLKRNPEKKIVYKDTGSPALGGTFFYLPVLLRRVGGVKEDITSKWESPMMMGFSGYATDNATEALYEWRDAIIGDKIKNDPTAWKTLVEALTEQHNGYVAVMPPGSTPPRKTVSFFMTSFVMGYAGVRDAVGTDTGGNKQSTEINIPGLAITPKKITADWIKARVISVEERHTVETLLTDVEKWAYAESVRRLYPDDVVMPEQRDDRSRTQTPVVEEDDASKRW